MCDPAHVCTLALQYNRAVHKTEGTAEKLNSVAPGTRTHSIGSILKSGHGRTWGSGNKM